MIRATLFSFAMMLALAAVPTLAADPDPLDIGVAGHAFDHLSDIGDQAAAAAQSGSNIIYASGIGEMEYQGLGTPEQIQHTRAAIDSYLRSARSSGIRLAIGYVCATSIVKLPTFDQNWSPEFRSQFSSPPAGWLQQDRDGKPLPSWYGGDYRPACMNNPNWRVYEKFMVRQQLEAGFDGIFFDNPTVHPQGCYCEYCMKNFRRFLAADDPKLALPSDGDVAALRKVASDRPKDFLRFRGTIAADFLADIRAYARTIKPAALITCNNSLNSPDVFFSQCRDDGYNINALSKVEDLIVIEDMATQPRTLSNGVAIEYGPEYEMLGAIGHSKPIVATVLADADYHTPPNLMRLAMAEAAAHEASYLSWPTWPESVRDKMIAAVRPEAVFLRQNAELLNRTSRHPDAVLFLPFSRWVETAECQPMKIAQALAAANVQFQVLDEDDLAKMLSRNAPPLLLVESATVLNDSEKQAIDKYQAGGGKMIWSDRPDWFAKFQKADSKPEIVIDGAPSIRAVVREQSNRTIVHLLNLNVQKVSDFEDRVNPVSSLRLHVRCESGQPKSVKALSADAAATHGELQFTAKQEGIETVLDITVPRIDVSTILVIE
jgi:hypothetical protein